MRGSALKACGLASHVVSGHCLDDLAAEVAHAAEVSDDAVAARGAIEALLDARELASEAFLDDRCEAEADDFLALARVCFEPSTLPEIRALLEDAAGANNPLARAAAANIDANEQTAATLLDLLDKSAGLGWSRALALEKDVLLADD